MPIDFILYGNPYPEIQIDLLNLQMARETLIACQKNRDFEVVELRHLQEQNDEVIEIIVVDCLSDGVSKWNKVGIKKRERIALVFSSNKEKAPQVRALRKDFPSTAVHLYSVRIGEPAHICLYTTSWADIERTWTPKSFLTRILWWLSGTANGTLHHEDQPVEQMFYQSPFKIILPPDFMDKYSDKQYKLILQAIDRPSHQFNVILGKFIRVRESEKHQISKGQVLLLDMPSVVHARPESYGQTLGETHDRLEMRGIDLLRQLNESIMESVPSDGIPKNSVEWCLIVMCIPIKRAEEKAPEKIETLALMVSHDLASLGKKTGVLSLFSHDNKYYVVPNIGVNEEPVSSEWRDLPVTPIEIRYKINKLAAQKASGITYEASDFDGVIVGVGALGSVLIDLWSREAWGNWTLLDHDTLEPHNIVRHIAKDNCIGHQKVEAVKAMVEGNYHEGCYLVKTIADSGNNFNNPNVVEALTKAALIVDATTTLGFPHDIAQRGDIPRSVSVFLSPSGQSSVLLFESSDRNVRLDALESQYYRAVINSDWGRDHLLTQSGIRVGTGCRDISAVISNELILMHAANIARQVRILRNQEKPYIRVWISDPEMGALDVKDIHVNKVFHTEAIGWSVVWDEVTANKLFLFRKKALPNETGGIVLGFMDQKIKKIFIVDVLDAPPDSERKPDYFIRGVEGLKETLDAVSLRTGSIVGYIGEWHSHPVNISANPSLQDMKMFDELAETLSKDGLPALMVIVTKDNIHLELKENHD